MFTDQKSMKIIFDAAAAAIKEEDKLLRSHCSKPCGYHHGIGWVREPILVHLIFRKLIGMGLDYNVRLEQAYPGNQGYQADLVLMLDEKKWAVCVEAKWIESSINVDNAGKDIDRMKQALDRDVGKFLLAFWVKSPENEKKIDEWLKRLEQVSGDSRPRTDKFDTNWYKEDEQGNPKLLPIEAGITLFEVFD